jgi:16S rRNA (cytosine967-C5)-methyltransferase
MSIVAKQRNQQAERAHQEQAPAGLAARKTAQAILAEVLGKKRPLDQVLAPLSALPRRDAGFARAIASETLRRFGQLDALVHAFVDKLPPPHRAGPVLEILLAGACELRFLKVPPHAAVDAANRLAQADRKAVHFKPLINAVLRRIAAEGEAKMALQDIERLNLPDWLWSRWLEQFGEDSTRALVRAQLAPAPTDIVLKDANCTPLPEGERVFEDVIRLDHSVRVDALPGFEGQWWVQDLAASLPARLLGEVRGKDVIDLCAAPGGKTAQLAAKGAHVLAVDSNSSRMERLKDNLMRLGLSARLVHEDARDFRASASLVLLDAPCSATGTIRRHPDLPWIKNAEAVHASAMAASELLDAASEMTVAGGLLVFSVCSLEREEGEEQVEAFLEGHRDFARVPVDALEFSGHAEWISKLGDLRTFPHHLADKGGMDGFYAARLRRRL